jgi:hypothetical protein
VRIDEAKGVMEFSEDLIKAVPKEHRLAAKVAKSVVKQRTEKFLTYRALGVKIDFLEGRIAKNYFNPTAFDRDPAEAAQAFMEAIDWNKTYTGTLSKEEFIERLQSTIRTGKTLDLSEEIDKLYDAIIDVDALGAADFNLAKKLGKSRHVHIKPEKWHEFNAKYGVGDIYDAIRKEQQTDARHMTLLDAFGTDPGANWDAIRKMLRDSNPELIKSSKHIADIEKVEALYPQLAGYADRPDNFLLARLANSARKLTSTVKLGMGFLSALTDLTNPANRKALYIASDDVGDQINKYVSGVAENFGMAVGLHGTETAKAIYASSLEIIQDMQNSFHKQARFMDVVESFTLKSEATMLDKVLNATDHYNDLIFKFNFMQAWTETGLARGYVSLSKELGYFANKSLNELPKNFRAALRELDIEDLWEVARKKTIKDPIDPEQLFMSPTAFDEIADEDLVSILKDVRGRDLELEKRTLSQRWRAAFATEADLRISNPSLSKKAATIGVARRGTAWGEIRRSVMQFKTFPIVQMTETIIPALKANRAGALGAWIAVSIPMQMQIMTIRNLLGGYTPPDFSASPEGAQNWAVLMTRIAGFPFVDDLINKTVAAMAGQDTVPADELLAAGLGPVAADIGTVVAGGANILANTVQGDAQGVAKSALKIAKISPFIGPTLTGHAGAKVFQNVFYDNIYATFADPDYFDKKDEYAKRLGSSYTNYATDPEGYFEAISESFSKDR